MTRALPAPFAIRGARLDELPGLQRIEREAGALFVAFGVTGEGDVLSIAAMVEAHAAALLWVVADGNDAPVAFAACWAHPDALHLREIDVDPLHMRRGFGRALVDHARRVASARGLSQVTLTTFLHVPWNAPLYRRYGFAVLDDAALPAWLAAIRVAETPTVGDAALPRVAMSIASLP